MLSEICVVMFVASLVRKFGSFFSSSLQLLLVQAPHKWLGQQAGGLMDQHSRRRKPKFLCLLARGGWGVDFEIKSWARKKAGMHEEWQLTDDKEKCCFLF